MKKLLIILISILLLTAAVFSLWNLKAKGNYVEKSQTETDASSWNKAVSESVNEAGFSLYVDEVPASSDKVYMNENMCLMFTQSAIRDLFSLAVDYTDMKLTIARGDSFVYADFGENFMIKDDEEIKLENGLVFDSGILYIPLEILINGFGFKYSWDGEARLAYIVTDAPDVTKISAYRSFSQNKLSLAKNQENLGACWAFAALSALEYSLLPDEVWDFSEDNMIYNNSFGTEPGTGGDYIMALSYLAAWQGPVNEEADLYNDGEHPTSLEVVKHVQGAAFIESRDFTEIKKFVYKYGAVEASLYISLEDGKVDSEYYNDDTFSYCYMGDEPVNHEIIIIGWDDLYPASNFKGAVSDGAFICMNSWGSSFGDNGIFYVSYEDTKIATYAVAYTNVEDADNYDNIYQYDFCGWAGSIGFDNETAYFANVFTAESLETLKAVSFYSLTPGSEYAVYVISDYNDEADLNTDGLVYASGTLENSGYYTINLNYPGRLSPGKKFAVIVKITSPNEDHPVAVCVNNGDERTSTVSTKGAQSYISSNGRVWVNTQNESDCIVCLKAFTDNR